SRPAGRRSHRVPCLWERRSLRASYWPWRSSSNFLLHPPQLSLRLWSASRQGPGGEACLRVERSSSPGAEPAHEAIADERGVAHRLRSPRLVIAVDRASTLLA